MTWQIQSWPTPQIFVKGVLPIRRDFPHVAVSLRSMLVASPVAQTLLDLSQTGSLSMIAATVDGPILRAVADDAATAVSLASFLKDGPFVRALPAQNTAAAVTLKSGIVYTPISHSVSDFPNTAAVTLKSGIVYTPISHSVSDFPNTAAVTLLSATHNQDTRVTEAGETRVTQAGDTRVTR